MLLEPLRHGDVVDVIAPASRCSDKELRDAVRALKALGFKPRVPRNLFGKTKIFANTDEQRARQLHRALNAPDSKLIWCVRGGYGAIRLMPEVVRWAKPKHPKILLGYSDITTLHAHLNRKWGWPSLHGPLLDRLGRGTMSSGEKKQLFGMLFGQFGTTEFRHLKPLNAAARKSRTVRGPVLGGNITVLQSGLGTASVLRVKGSILFFEDTGEKPHKVDRMFAQMEQAGWFREVKAVILGHFLLEDPKLRRILWDDVIPRFAQSQKIPVLSGLPSGHDPKHQYTIPLNTKAELQLGAKPRLIVSSGIRTK